MRIIHKPYPHPLIFAEVGVIYIRLVSACLFFPCRSIWCSSPFGDGIVAGFDCLSVLICHTCRGILLVAFTHPCFCYCRDIAFAFGFGWAFWLDKKINLERRCEPLFHLSPTELRYSLFVVTLGRRESSTRSKHTWHAGPASAKQEEIKISGRTHHHRRYTSVWWAWRWLRWCARTIH